jgi:hypothetical protein
MATATICRATSAQELVIREDNLLQTERREAWTEISINPSLMTMQLFPSTIFSVTLALNLSCGCFVTTAATLINGFVFYFDLNAYILLCAPQQKLSLINKNCTNAMNFNCR